MKITAPSADALVSLDGVDLCNPAVFRAGCQHAVWQTMRFHAPVCWQTAPNGTGLWSVTRYADCERVLREHQTFSSEHGTILSSVGVGDAASGETMTVTDPPRHSQLRKPLLGKLGRAVVRRCAQQMRQEVSRVVAPLLDNGRADFVAVMQELPMAMMAPMMGIPQQLRPEISHWSAVSIAPDEPQLNGGLDARAAARQAHVHLLDLFSATIAMRADDPGDDVMTALTQLLLDGESLTDSQVGLNCYSLMMGAHATTPHVASQTVAALAERPELWSAGKSVV